VKAKRRCANCSIRISDSMMILDLETGRYIDVNEEYIRHTGYSREM